MSTGECGRVGAVLSAVDERQCETVHFQPALLSDTATHWQSSGLEGVWRNVRGRRMSDSLPCNAATTKCTDYYY